MASLSYNKETERILPFKSTSRYLGDLLNINNRYSEGRIGRIYPREPQLYKANASDTEAPFLDLHSSISNGFLTYRGLSFGFTFIYIGWFCKD